MKRFVTLGVAVVALVVFPRLAGQGIATEMTPALIAEAIAAGENGKVSDGALTKGGILTNGSTLIAAFSTPYMRVAAAARKAKKEYRKFTSADVTPEMIAPELHVYAFAKTDGPAVANVTAVVITPRDGNDQEKAAKAVQSIRSEVLPTEFQNLAGAKLAGEGRLAVFPLSALSEANEVHVVYDRRARYGYGGASKTCENCAMGFSTKNVR